MLTVWLILLVVCQCICNVTVVAKHFNQGFFNQSRFFYSGLSNLNHCEVDQSCIIWYDGYYRKQVLCITCGGFKSTHGMEDLRFLVQF